MDEMTGRGRFSGVAKALGLVALVVVLVAACVIGVQTRARGAGAAVVPPSL